MMFPHSSSKPRAMQVHIGFDELDHEVNDIATVIAKGANAAILQLQTFYKASAASGGKQRRQVLPLLHVPLADLRKRNWAAQIPSSLAPEETGVVVHLSRDLAAGGDIAMAGAAVLTHSHVLPPPFSTCVNFRACSSSECLSGLCGSC